MAKGDLVITRFPGRKGWFLGMERDGGVESLARFRDEVAVEKFAEWVKTRTDIDYRDERSGNDGQKGE